MQNTLRLDMSWLLVPLALLFSEVLRFASAQNVAPVSVPPSQYWEGDDGQWSTFQLRVGTPPQDVRVMASTASPVTWVVIDQACPGGDSSSCAIARGDVFSINASTTWSSKGFFNLYLEGNLNYTGNGDYGSDTVGLGLTNQSGPALTNQVVAAIETTDFYFGVFGLNPQPTNFTTFNDPIPSYFSTLKSQNLIPSLTWSYTAGNPYSLKKVLGSLIFGGYDQSRFIPNSLTFYFAPDTSRDIVVGVQSISSTESSGKTTELLTDGVLAFIDSTIAYIYLPLDVCQQFESAFGLVWDPDAEFYLVDNALHSSLLARGLNFTFTLGNDVSGGETIDIILPYAAFDLQLTSPLVNGTSSYFPLRRGNNTQYTLGRTFLQEAYLTVDYERGNFSVSQCIFVEGAPEEIVTIHPMGYVAPNNGTGPGVSGGSGSSTSSSSLATGAIVGIAVCGFLILAGALLLGFAYRKRKWPFQKRGSAGSSDNDSEAIGYEADGTMLTKFPKNDAHEIGGTNKLNFPDAELESERVEAKNELPGVPVLMHHGSHGELHGSDAAMEVEGSVPFMELPGSPVPSEFLGQSQATADMSGKSPRTTGAGSLREDHARKSSGPGVRSRGSNHSGSSTLVSPGSLSPGSEFAEGTRSGRTMSKRSGTEGYLMSPLSAGSEPRDFSQGRSAAGSLSSTGRSGRSAEGGGHHNISQVPSRDPSGTRDGDPPPGYI